MCRELETAGLSAPEYHINAFMLQATIYNSENQKSAIEGKKSAIEGKKLAIKGETSAIEGKKLAIEGETSAIEKLNSAISTRKYTETTKQKILQVYNEIDTNQIFGASDIARILNCAPSTARLIMVKLREIEVVKEVKGKGKGKYIFQIKD